MPRAQFRALPTLPLLAALAASARAQQADLVVDAVDDSAVGGNFQQLTVNGSAGVAVRNQGAGGTGIAFDVLVFEDHNGNGTYEPAFDNALGSTVTSALGPGAAQLVSVAVSGSVLFRQSPLHALVDASDVVAESDELNNYGDSGDDCAFAPVPGPLQATLEWSWTASMIEPSALNVMMTPGVVDLTGDGVPEVIFGSTASTGGSLVEIGFLRALDGATGAEVFTQNDPNLRVNTASSVAVGDLDGDGLPEIVACDTTGRQLICFEHDGSFKWRSGLLEPINWGAPAIADLDQDGVPEIVQGRQVLDAAGNLLWTGSGGVGGAASVGPLSLVSDVDLDGSPDVVAGNTVYSGSGAILYQNPSLPDGTVAVANFDADPQAEIVSVIGGVVRLLDLGPGSALTEVWSAAIPGGGAGGPPTIADYDGDGLPEIGVAGASRYAVFEDDGTLKWAAVTQDASSNRTGSSVFDFNGDGSAEVVYRDELNLRIYRGSDGLVLFQVPMSSCTWHEYVLVADVDADGNAEIVAVANNNCGLGPQRGVFVFGATNDDWVPTRRVWNQHTYHITNVTESGMVPQFETENWLTPPSAPFNNFRQNVLNPLNPQAAPDLTASYLRASSTLMTVTARIGNAGSALVGAGLPVSFYDGDPSGGGMLLGTAATTAAMFPGGFEDVTLALAVPVPGVVWVGADDAGGLVSTENECDETNNTHSASVLLDLVCPPDVIEIWAGGPAVQADPNLTGFATFVDSCDPNAVLTYTDSLDPGDAPGEPETIVTRTWMLSDTCGNVLTCQQRITLLSPSLGSANLELDLTSCQDEIEPTGPATVELTLLGNSQLDLANVRRGSLRLRRMEDFRRRIVPIDAGAPLADVATAAAARLGQCNLPGPDGFADLRLVFDRNQVAQRLGLQELEPGSLTCLVITGRRPNGQKFAAATVVTIR